MYGNELSAGITPIKKRDAESDHPATSFLVLECSELDNQQIAPKGLFKNTENGLLEGPSTKVIRHVNKPTF